MSAPNKWGAAKRTKADRENDLAKFLSFARPQTIAASTAEELAGRYGVDLKIAKYNLAIAQQRLAG